MAGIVIGIVMMFLGVVVLGAVEILVQLRRARPEQEAALRIRKLARKAVIFALLGQLLATAWFFVTGDRGNRALAMGIAARPFTGSCITTTLIILW